MKMMKKKAKKILAADAIIKAPWPPSVNHYWKGSGNRRFLSRYAKDWHEAFHLAWIEAGKPRMGTAVVTIIATPPDSRKRDLDNIMKAVLDALVKVGAIQDDSIGHVAELHVYASKPAKPGCVEVLLKSPAFPIRSEQDSYRS